MNEVNGYSTAAGAVVGSVLIWAVLRFRMMSQVVVHSQRMFEQQRSQLEASFREVYESKLGEWKATMGKIKQNLSWAFAYNTVLIPVAASGFLNPILAGVAMALSSVSVVTNSLSLNMVKLGAEK